MPSSSRAQQRLMQAAEHSANFPMARKVRSSMTSSQMHDFAAGSEKGKPQHVGNAYAKAVAPTPKKNHPHANLGAYLHKSKKAR